MRQDFKILENFWGKVILRYCKRNKRKLKYCTNNNRYDKKLRKPRIIL